MKNKSANRRLEVLDLGMISYQEGMKFQEERILLRQQEKTPDTLLLLEHLPVFTLGVSASEKDILWDNEECRRKSVEVQKTTRGGKVTFHGPGQLVGYPIIKLVGGGREVVKYVSMLEEVIIDALKEFGIEGRRDKRNRGVWIGNDKIAAIGVKIAGGISFHGFALNVRTDLSFYDGIVPCGIKDGGITSLHKIVPQISMEEVKKTVVEKFRNVFGYDR
mgnify:CR=1 FL=1